MKYISNEEGGKLLPCFSLCPLPAYKSSDWNYVYTKIGYKENTFKLEDIFSKAHAILLQNKTEYSVSETESIFWEFVKLFASLERLKHSFLNSVWHLKGIGTSTFIFIQKEVNFYSFILQLD